MSKRIAFLLLLTLLPFSSCKKEEEGGGGGGGVTPREVTVTGCVKGNNNQPIAGVVVSDGIYCTKTDEQGNYALGADLSKADFVFVSTPSNWKAPKKNGHAIFWKKLADYTPSSGKYSGVDFTLEPISNPDRFTIFIYGDPQPRNRSASTDKYVFASLDACQDMYKDMKEYASTLTGRPIYGIGLGDIVHQSTSLLDQYLEGMKTTGITTYNVIGNHDQKHEMGKTDPESSKAFEEKMGPTNYSFNLGNLHFLMIDNMIIREGSYSDDCKTGLTDDIWTFVQNDLSYVPSDMEIMVCGHSPMFRLQEGTDRTDGGHLRDLRNLLMRFKRVYAWAGHTHSTFNYYDKSSNLEVHTLGRVTGALWTNEFLSENGTPRGYMVFEYDGGKANPISWKFKPTYWQTGTPTGSASNIYDYSYRDWDYDASGRAVMKSTGELLSDSYQMQVFKPGSYDANDKTVYVNVFLWDEAWKKPTFQPEGGLPSTMTRMEASRDTDPYYLYRYSKADWEVTDWYATKYLNLSKEWYTWNDAKTQLITKDNKKRNCASIFRYQLNTTSAHGSGVVSVKDRFGNTYTSSVSW